MQPQMLHSLFFWWTIFIPHPPPRFYLCTTTVPYEMGRNKIGESNGIGWNGREERGRLSAATYRWANNEHESMYIAGGESIAWPSISSCGGVIEFSPGSCVSQVPSHHPLLCPCSILFVPFRSPRPAIRAGDDVPKMDRDDDGELLSCERIPP